jgi:hypothetical protein
MERARHLIRYFFSVADVPSNRPATQARLARAYRSTLAGRLLLNTPHATKFFTRADHHERIRVDRIDAFASLKLKPVELSRRAYVCLDALAFYDCESATVFVFDQSAAPTDATHELTPSEIRWSKFHPFWSYARNWSSSVAVRDDRSGVSGDSTQSAAALALGQCRRRLRVRLRAHPRGPLPLSQVARRAEGPSPAERDQA